MTDINDLIERLETWGSPKKDNARQLMREAARALRASAGGEMVEGVVRLALHAFDDGVGDPNDFHRRMRKALLAVRAALSTPEGWQSMETALRCSDGKQRTLVEWLNDFRRMTKGTGYLWMADDAEKFAVMLAAALATRPRDEATQETPQ